MRHARDCSLGPARRDARADWPARALSRRQRRDAGSAELRARLRGSTSTADAESSSRPHHPPRVRLVRLRARALVRPARGPPPRAPRFLAPLARRALPVSSAMSSTKDGAASNKVMSAMGEVETFIAAVKEKTADEVRDAARAFEKKTGGAVSGLGDASGRTPLHLVRARPAPRFPSPRAALRASPSRHRRRRRGFFPARVAPPTAHVSVSRLSLDPGAHAPIPDRTPPKPPHSPPPLRRLSAGTRPWCASSSRT